MDGNKETELLNEFTSCVTNMLEYLETVDSDNRKQFILHLDKTLVDLASYAVNTTPKTNEDLNGKSING